MSQQIQRSSKMRRNDTRKPLYMEMTYYQL